MRRLVPSFRLAKAPRLTAFRRDDAGAVSVFFILAFPLVIAGFALSTEVGFWMSEQRRVQNVSDAAAFSVGINAAHRGFDCAELSEDADAWQSLEDTARRVATESGLPPDATDITISCPQADQISVQIERALPVFLLRALMPLNGDAAASHISASPRGLTVIALTPSDETGGTGSGDGGPELVCIHALNPDGRALIVGEETEIDAPECRIQVDSDNNNSIVLGDEAEVDAACITTRGRVREGDEVELDLGPPGSECEDIRERTDPEPLPPRLENFQTLAGLGDLPDDGLGNWRQFGNTVEISTTRQHPGSNLAVRRFSDLTLGQGWSRWDRHYIFEPGLYVIEGGLQIRDGVRVTLEDGAAFVLLDGASIDIHHETRVDFGTGLAEDQCDPAPCPWAGLVLFAMGEGGSNGWQDFHANQLDAVVYLPGYSLRTARWEDARLGRGCFAILADRFEFRNETEVDITCDEEDRLRLCAQLGFESCGTTAGPNDDDTGVVIIR